MKLRDIIDPLLALLNDARAAELLLEEQDSAFARRAYVRSSFAYYEGAVWLLKQACLHGHGSRRHSLAEYALLRDESYELKSSGEPHTQTKFLRLPDNLRFSVKVFNRLFRAEVDLGVGTASWDRFREALKVRHRITHPKSVRDYEISADEITLCKDVTSWFNEIVHAAVRAIITASEKHSTKADQDTVADPNRSGAVD